MFVAAFLAVLVGAALANPVRDESKDEEWDLYKSMFNKKYSVEDEPLRRMVWERNLAYVNQHNLRADLREFSFRLGMNEYADMTNEEFVKTMNGRLNRTTAKSSQKFLNEDIKDLPDTVDWRTKGYVTPVKNQGQCGSCWAFSTTGSLEGQHFKTKGSLVSLSEQNLVDCSAAEGNQGCNGGLMDQGFEYIKENHGIDTEASYPYTAKDGKCHFNAKNVGATATGFVDIKTGSESALQNAVATVGPISVAIDAGHISFQLYRSGVYSSIFCSQTKLDHGVLAVGYGTYGDKLYWLVKNSWGESWGQNGYIMMARNDDNMCGIATQASYPTV